MTLSRAITPGQSGSESDANEGVLFIPQSSGNNKTSPSDCLALHRQGGLLPFCRKAVGVFYSPKLSRCARIWSANDYDSQSSSSSSSCRAGSTDIPDPLSPLFPIVHRLRQVFWTTSRILK